jgi:membrane protease YdiL (CAAX protease family)
MNLVHFLIIQFIAYFASLFLISKTAQSTIGNRIKGMKYDILLFFVQTVPVFVAIFYYEKSPATLGITLDNFKLSLVIGICIGIIAVLVEYFWLDARLLLSSEVLRVFPKIKRTTFWRRIVDFLALSPIAEETLYRGSIQMTLLTYLGPISIVVTTIMFAAQHFVDPLIRQHYANRKNQVFLFYEGLALGATAYVSGSLIGCIVAHMLMNFLSALARIRKYLYFNNPQKE